MAPPSACPVFYKQHGLIQVPPAALCGRSTSLTRKFHTFPARSADSTTSIGRNGDPPLCSVFTQRHRRITVSTNPGGTLHASDSKKCEIYGLSQCHPGLGLSGTGDLCQVSVWPLSKLRFFEVLRRKIKAKD